MKYFLLVVVAELVFFWIGFIAGHRDVAHECKTLGAFYVGNDVFKCVEITAEEQR